MLEKRREEKNHPEERKVNSFMTMKLSHCLHNTNPSMDAESLYLKVCCSPSVLIKYKTETTGEKRGRDAERRGAAIENSSSICLGPAQTFSFVAGCFFILGDFWCFYCYCCSWWLPYFLFTWKISLFLICTASYLRRKYSVFFVLSDLFRWWTRPIRQNSNCSIVF